MTTPERLRRRQRRESAGIAVLAVALVASVIYFDRQDNSQRECFYNFIEADSATGAIRSGLVERESGATRKIIRRVFEGESDADRLQAYEDYKAEQKSIKKAREENPVEPFDPESCYE